MAPLMGFVSIARISTCLLGGAVCESLGAGQDRASAMPLARDSAHASASGVVIGGFATKKKKIAVHFGHDDQPCCRTGFSVDYVTQLIL